MDYKHILVTGGAGFLGSHLVKKLVQKGCKIVVVDKRKGDITNVEYVVGDFAQHNLIAPILSQVQCVVHLAAVVGAEFSRQNPDEVLKINYEHAVELADLSAKSGVKKFFFSSSSEVYGAPHNNPHMQENGETSPLSVYGKAKRRAEALLEKLSNKERDFSVGVARFFNIYGPGQTPDFVVAKFIQLAVENKPITLHNDGSQRRNFTYVNDAIRGAIAILEYDKSAFEIFNIVNPKSHTIKEVAYIVLQALPDSTSKIAYTNTHKTTLGRQSREIYQKRPAADKAKRLLGFEARVTLKDGIDRYVL